MHIPYLIMLIINGHFIDEVAFLPPESEVNEFRLLKQISCTHAGTYVLCEYCETVTGHYDHPVEVWEPICACRDGKTIEQLSSTEFEDGYETPVHTNTKEFYWE